MSGAAPDGTGSMPAYFDKGTMAQIGHGAAVAELPTGQTLTGGLAWLAWLGVHLALLNGAEERISTFVDWGLNLLTKEHSKRIILSDGEATEPVSSPADLTSTRE